MSVLDEWRVVRRKNKFCKKIYIASSASDSVQTHDGIDNSDKIENRVKRALIELEATYFAPAALRILHKITEARDLKEIVCYGLGSLCGNPSSVYQLAFILLMNNSITPNLAPKLLAFDPAFTGTDLVVLQRFGISVIDNDECRRCVSVPTLFYMIHCDMWMYNNILWANWSPENLRLVTIFGNSFKAIEERTPSRILKNFYKYISVVSDFCQEESLPQWEEHDTVFNDTAIITFNCFKSNELKLTDFHHNTHPPVYEDT